MSNKMNRQLSAIGATALVPILDREIPVIADEAVNREFGGGASALRLGVGAGADVGDGLRVTAEATTSGHRAGVEG